MTEQQWVSPDVMVDVVILTIHEGRLSTVLVEREFAPEAGRLALIGGYVHTEVGADKDLDETAMRVLRQKAGLEGIFVEQLKTFSFRRKDNRWVVIVAYYALLPVDTVLAAGKRLVIKPIDEVGQLPFDHNAILDAAVDRVRGKGAYSTLPAQMLPPVFTLPELQRTYEIVLGEVLDKKSFRRKVADLDIIEKEDGKTRPDRERRRPTELFRIRPGIRIFERRM